MTSIKHLTLEVSSPDIDAARDFYSSARGAVPQIRLPSTDSESYGFRGFPRDRHIDRVTLILGVADIKQGRQHYIDHGGRSHRIIIGADPGAFVDPDAFAWESASAAVDVRVNHREDARERD